MKPPSPHLSAWQRALRRLASLLARPSRAAPREGADWAARSAVGEEDPGASVDLLDTRPPAVPPLKGGGPPRA